MLDDWLMVPARRQEGVRSRPCSPWPCREEILGAVQIIDGPAKKKSARRPPGLPLNVVVFAVHQLLSMAWSLPRSVARPRTLFFDSRLFLEVSRTRHDDRD